MSPYYNIDGFIYHRKNNGSISVCTELLGPELFSARGYTLEQAIDITAIVVNAYESGLRASEDPDADEIAHAIYRRKSIINAKPGTHVSIQLGDLSAFGLTEDEAKEVLG